MTLHNDILIYIYTFFPCFFFFRCQKSQKRENKSVQKDLIIKCKNKKPFFRKGVWKGKGGSHEHFCLIYCWNPVVR